MWSIILTITLTIWVSVDIWCFISGKEKTLSRQIVDWSKQWPLLPFILGLAVGTLAGHFWPIA